MKSLVIKLLTRKSYNVRQSRGKTILRNIVTCRDYPKGVEMINNTHLQMAINYTLV